MRKLIRENSNTNFLEVITMTDEQTHTQIQYILLIDRLDALEDFRRRLRAKAVKLGGQLGKSRRTVEGDFLPFKRHSLT